MKEQKQLIQEQLRERAVQFYARYKDEMEEVTRLFAIHLNQFALAYTTENKLPKEAVSVTTRMKSLDSFLKKLMRIGYPSFYNPTEIITDLIGGRVTCWFLEDCYGILNQINSSKKIGTRKDTLEDYINQPKKTGYRSIHILADVLYDAFVKDNIDSIKVDQRDFVCEIQIRTKLQDFWGDLTHEFHYTRKEFGENESTYEKLVSEMANRFAAEDHSTFTLRILYQSIAEESLNRKIGRDLETEH
jgi:putative GTP pyrophosphokinase